MSKNKNKEAALVIADDLCDNYSKNILFQVASTLFQRTLEMKNKNKWSSAEDDMIMTFFYLSSKEELCEALSCDMESLYLRARHLGVVSPSFSTLTATDLRTAVDLFAYGRTQEDVLSVFGIESVSVPIKPLTLNEQQHAMDLMKVVDSSQMEISFNEDYD